MEIRLLNEIEYGLSKALWEECFSDGARYIDWYYKARSKPEYVLGAFCGEYPVAMLHMIPVSMRFSGRGTSVCLVSGVCTKPDFRRRGVCAELFDKAFPIMRERGFSAAVLQPFEPAFYERFGFKTYIYRQRVTLSYDRPTKPDGRTNTPNDRTTMEEAASKLTRLYNVFFKEFEGASLRGEEYFKGFIEEYSAPEARLVIKDEGCAAGYDEDGVFVCTELFFEKGTDPVSLLPGGFAKYVFPLPEGYPVPAGCRSEREAFSMLKPLDPDFDPGFAYKYGFDRY